MCSPACVAFGKRVISPDQIKSKRIIEIGARDMNGSLQTYIKAQNPKEYIGIDIIDGPGVDLICNATELIQHFEKDSFDLIIATEVLEHITDWKKAISNFKQLLKKNGILFVTTRSRLFPFHGAPYDFWRYSIEDMKNIFSDLDIEVLEKDPLEPGVFLKAIKAEDFKENNLDNYSLYSIIYRRRISGHVEIANIPWWLLNLNKLEGYLRTLLAKSLPRSFKQKIKATLKITR